jgi:hypothetical protein
MAKLSIGIGREKSEQLMLPLHGIGFGPAPSDLLCPNAGEEGKRTILA